MAVAHDDPAETVDSSMHEAPAPNAALVPERGGHRALLGLRIGQVVILELAVAAVIVGVVIGGPVLWVTGGAAALAALFTLARARRRWLYEWVPIRHAFRRRLRQAVIVADDIDPQLAPLAEMIPGLSLGSALGLKNGSMGVVHDGLAWTVVVAVEPDDARAGRVTLDAIPIGRLAELVATGEMRLAAVQALLQLVPAPSVFHSPSDACAASYRQLHPSDLPSAHTAAVALRLDPAVCADALAARGGSIEVVHKALRRSAHRAVDVLDEAGFRTRLLTQEELQVVLADSAGVQLLAVPEEGWRTAETRLAQFCDGTAHVTHWLRDWPIEGLATLQSELCAVPTLYTSVAVTVAADDRPGQEGAAITALVRATTGPDTAAEASAAMERAARAAGAVLVPLRGAQLPGLLASIPLGGGPMAAALRVPPHRVPAGALEALEAPLEHGGLVVGSWPDGAPAVAPVFRAAPTRVGVVGTHYVAFLLAYRAIAIGARVDIVTARPEAWTPLVQAAPPDGDWVTIHPVDSATPLPGTSVRPSLIIEDVSDEAHGLRSDLGAWQTTLTLRRNVSVESAGAMSSFDLVLLQRVAAETARLARTALNLPDARIRMLPMMPDDSIAVAAGGDLSVLSLVATDIERAAFAGM